MGLVGIGLVLAEIHQGAKFTGLDGLTFGIGLALAAALAWTRAKSMTVFRGVDGQWMSRGSWVTVVLWLVLIGSHVAVGVLASVLDGAEAGPSAFGQATIPLFIGVSIAMQTFRGRLVPAAQSATQADPVGALR